MMILIWSSAITSQHICEQKSIQESNYFFPPKLAVKDSSITFPMNKSGYSISKLIKTLIQVKLQRLVQRWTQYKQKKLPICKILIIKAVIVAFHMILRP